MKILRVYLPVVCFILFCSCEKLVETKKRDALLEIMTSGQWHVESYIEGTIVITDQFQGFNFQFNEDGSVTGNDGLVITTGTWVGDIRNYSISSNFPSAPDPLKKLNGTWIIKDSGLDYVAAEMKNIQGIMILRLRKNS